QEEIFRFIQGFVQEHGVPPTVRELGGRFKISPRGAFDHLRALERKGYLHRRASARRTSRVLSIPGGRSSAREIPILGRIAAGAPLLALENREGSLSIGAESLSGKGDDLFALRVRGESMVGAHILDGDLVLVRRQPSADAGDIVVAMMEGEATVKRFSREGKNIILKPENPAMAPITVPPGREVRILGKVVGLLRGL
ncbi:MAG: transcriptional repressor LexA, partial [Candidatus Rokubacteria bacterium]|nr:transcriptional repressor LexA [Candidatus Rokubacteria bacterium]